MSYYINPTELIISPRIEEIGAEIFDTASSARLALADLLTVDILALQIASYLPESDDIVPLRAAQDVVEFNYDIRPIETALRSKELSQIADEYKREYSGRLKSGRRVERRWVDHLNARPLILTSEVSRRVSPSLQDLF